MVRLITSWRSSFCTKVNWKWSRTNCAGCLRNSTYPISASYRANWNGLSNGRHSRARRPTIYGGVQSTPETDHFDKFRQEREALNEKILARDDLNIKRFFALDSAVYKEGALSAKTKEMLGLVASLVLRCDDCITYHVIQAAGEKVTDKEFDEVMSIGMLVGGSITIPHVRRAYKRWEELKG